MDPRNVNCENYDPCIDKKPIIADFTFGQIYVGWPFNGSTKFVNEDTVFLSGGIHGIFEYGTRLRFKASLEKAKYIWKLGSETITDQEFDRIFTKAGQGTFSITLMVEKEPDLACFPNDDGKDTLTKYFKLIPHYQLPIMGAYKVKFEDANDSNIVYIKPWEISHLSQQKNFKVIDTLSPMHTMLLNFANKKDTVTHFWFEGSVTGNRIFFMDGGGEYKPHDGFVKLLGRTIVADYQMDNRRIKFQGRKL